MEGRREGKGKRVTGCGEIEKRLCGFATTSYHVGDGGVRVRVCVWGGGILAGAEKGVEGDVCGEKRTTSDSGTKTKKQNSPCHHLNGLLVRNKRFEGEKGRKKSEGQSIYQAQETGKE